MFEVDVVMKCVIVDDKIDDFVVGGVFDCVVVVIVVGDVIVFVFATARFRVVFVGVGFARARDDANDEN